MNVFLTNDTLKACRGNEDKDDFGDWYKNGPGETNRLPTVNQIPALLDTMASFFSKKYQSKLKI